MANDPKPRIARRGPRRWVNQHENVRQRVQGLFDLRNPPTRDDLSTILAFNATASAVQALLGEALGAGIRVRALGAGWSFSPAAATEGWALNTQPLDFHFRVGAEVLTQAWKPRAERLRLVQCGLGMAQLQTDVLRPDGWSLMTSGASNGQTLAGAASTGTHGAAIDVGAVHDAILGIHLLAGPDPAHALWLQRASDPVVSPDLAGRLQARLVEDDELFAAAVVSFGSFGVIHGVLIETEPLYLLEAHRMRIPFEAPLRRAIAGLDFGGLDLPRPGERPYHFQVVVNPHDLAGGAFVTVMYKRPYRPDYTPPRRGARFAPGDDAPAFIGLLSDAAPAAAVPVLANALVGRSYGTYANKEGTLGEIFSNTTTRGKVASTAIGVALPDALPALDAVLDEQRRSGPFPGVVALRYVRGSQATLAFTRFDTTCVLELDGVRSQRTSRFYERAWRRLDDESIEHTFHWGKENDLDAAGVRRAYGQRVDTWLGARRTLLDSAALRRLFANDMLDRMDLSG